ncbi:MULTISPECIES: VOC family protein [unclassified Acidocella]|uniref:VOC family protein n=1 Tax=unclassified Acidocella TaxID=2648610 RepID=UPI00028D368D|nr:MULTISPECIES: VOC family protein [unclassified Acidocella]EKM99359.1 hypothetical protein MXAZACID_10795 [Acidocella sp. MX-AZ02]WBO58010.1 VOC family protein [Acidocella sp. MX-AZ03]
MLSAVQLRVARPTDNIEALIPFYRDGLGLDVLCRFENHNGFDGIMLGKVGVIFHFEFTRAQGHTVGRAPTQDNLLIFYLHDHDEWTAAINSMRSAGFMPVPAFNPYWDNFGCTFEDPDGYRIVIQRGSWEPE